MFKISTLNKISGKGLNLLSEEYMITENTAEADGILVRSQDMHSMELSDQLPGPEPVSTTFPLINAQKKA